mgnify:CR=1 FL=1
MCVKHVSPARYKENARLPINASKYCKKSHQQKPIHGSISTSKFEHKTIDTRINSFMISNLNTSKFERQGPLHRDAFVFDVFTSQKIMGDVLINKDVQISSGTKTCCDGHNEIG